MYFCTPPLAFAAGHVKITCLRCRRLTVFPLQISREYENLEIRLNFQASKFHRNFLLPLFLGSSTKHSFCSVLARLGDRRLLVPASQQSVREEVCLPQFTLNLRGFGLMDLDQSFSVQLLQYLVPVTPLV